MYVYIALYILPLYPHNHLKSSFNTHKHNKRQKRYSNQKVHTLSHLLFQLSSTLKTQASNMQEKSKMQRKRSVVARRAWNVLCLALLWARKGGIFKNKHLVDLRLLPKYIKSLRHNNDHYGALHYGEREFSFDDTPIIHVKMHRPTSLRFKMPNIPCIKPQVDFDFDFENDYEREDEMYNDDNNDDAPRKSFLNTDGEEDEYVSCEMSEEIIAIADDEAIDMKAEEFIAKFYEQIKLQKQKSYLQYQETLAN